MTQPPSNGSDKFARVSPAKMMKAPTESGPGGGKVMIGSLDDPSIFVQAMWNPKELEVTRSVPWQKPNQANKSNKRGQQASSGDQQGIHLEFQGADGRSLSLELLFDGYETEGNPAAKPPDGVLPVAESVRRLEQMASVRKPGSTKEDEKRPHRCIIVWGSVLPGFRCVIEQVTTKYTMFSSDGRPLRATCTVKVKEADIVSVAKKK